MGFKTEMENPSITVCDESDAVYTDSANDWKDIVTWYVIPITKMFHFEFGQNGPSFYKCTPDKTMAFKK